MTELPPFSVPCLLRNDQVLGVVSLLDEFPYSHIVVKPVKGTEGVRVTIFLSREANMLDLFSRMGGALKPPPNNTAVREGRVLGTCEEPQSLSNPCPNPISLLRRMSAMVKIPLFHPPTRT